jgi:2-polyprenyl-3-methyl-5-hydroxy-6-metoxy-1,4-benzoquinol methylase
MSGDDPCRICGGSTTPAFKTVDRNRRLTEDQFDYVRCQECGTLALANVPDDLTAYYTSEYYRLPDSSEQLQAMTASAEQAKLRLVQAWAPQGRLLEIGPAAGAFLAAAHAAGHDVEGIEMDRDCCSFIEQQLGVRVTHSADPAVALEGSGPFQAIMMWHVIEHLRDPAAVLVASAGALAPGGVLVIATPNPEALELRTLRHRWFHLDAPRHVFLLPSRTVAQLGAEHGLETVLLTTNGPAAADYVRGGWCESLAASVSGEIPKRAMLVLGAALVRLLSPIERRGLRGATYTIVLRKPLSGAEIPRKG